QRNNLRRVLAARCFGGSFGTRKKAAGDSSYAAPTPSRSHAARRVITAFLGSIARRAWRQIHPGPRTMGCLSTVTANPRRPSKDDYLARSYLIVSKLRCGA